jgi:hypothetical protein
MEQHFLLWLYRKERIEEKKEKRENEKKREKEKNFK